MAPVRVFIAVATPADVKARMSSLRNDFARLAPDVRWESAEKFHCTIRFLGNVETPALASVEEELRSAGARVPPLWLRYSGIGAFPDSMHPRVIWIGVSDGSGTLARLERLVSAGLDRLHFAPAERPFQPHVTLGRAGGSRTRARSSRLIDIVETRTFDHPPVIVPAVEIMQSAPGPRGSVYTVLTSIPLTGT